MLPENACRSKCPEYDWGCCRLRRGHDDGHWCGSCGYAEDALSSGRRIGVVGCAVNGSLVRSIHSRRHCADLGREAAGTCFRRRADGAEGDALPRDTQCASGVLASGRSAGQAVAQALRLGPVAGPQGFPCATEAAPAFPERPQWLGRRARSRIGGLPAVRSWWRSGCVAGVTQQLICSQCGDPWTTQWCDRCDQRVCNDCWDECLRICRLCSYAPFQREWRAACIRGRGAGGIRGRASDRGAVAPPHAEEPRCDEWCRRRSGRCQRICGQLVPHSGAHVCRGCLPPPLPPGAVVDGVQAGAPVTGRPPGTWNRVGQLAAVGRRCLPCGRIASGQPA